MSSIADRLNALDHGLTLARAALAVDKDKQYVEAEEVTEALRPHLTALQEQLHWIRLALPNSVGVLPALTDDERDEQGVPRVSDLAGLPH